MTRGSWGALVVLALVGVPAMGAAASQAVPAIPVFLGPPVPGKDPSLRPRVITYTGDGTGFFAGFGRAGRRPRVGRLHWSKWTTRVGVATGANWIDDCNPDCAGGLRTPYRVRLIVDKPKVLGGYEVFTRIRGTYTHSLPSFAHNRSFTMSLVYKPSSNDFFWKFPR
jgi:hypothetical protein